MAGMMAVSGLIDGRLRLLDPHAQLERLGLDRDLAAQQHAVSIAGTVADREDRQVRGDIAGGRREAAESAIGDVEVLHEASEADLAAERFDLATERSDHQGQPVGAEVRPMLVQDRRTAVTFRQDLQNTMDVGPGAARGELAIAEGAGPPLPEQVIALGVHRPVLVEPAHVGDPILDGSAPLENQWSEPRLSQEVSGEQAGRARAHDHRSMPEWARAGLGPVEPLWGVILDVRG